LAGAGPRGDQALRTIGTGQTTTAWLLPRPPSPRGRASPTRCPVTTTIASFPMRSSTSAPATKTPRPRSRRGYRTTPPAATPSCGADHPGLPGRGRPADQAVPRQPRDQRRGPGPDRSGRVDRRHRPLRPRLRHPRSSPTPWPVWSASSNATCATPARGSILPGRSRNDPCGCAGQPMSCISAWVAHLPPPSWPSSWTWTKRRS
jgi:hypothetical protein